MKLLRARNYISNINDRKLKSLKKKKLTFSFFKMITKEKVSFFTQTKWAKYWDENPLCSIFWKTKMSDRIIIEWEEKNQKKLDEYYFLFDIRVKWKKKIDNILFQMINSLWWRQTINLPIFLKIEVKNRALKIDAYVKGSEVIYIIAD